MIVESSKVQAAANQNSFTINYTEDIDPILTDASRVKTIIANILGNACKFTENGKITMDVLRQHEDDKDWIKESLPTPGQASVKSNKYDYSSPLAKLTYLPRESMVESDWDCL